MRTPQGTDHRQAGTLPDSRVDRLHTQSPGGPPWPPGMSQSLAPSRRATRQSSDVCEVKMARVSPRQERQERQ